MATIRIATRSSAQARTQAEAVGALLVSADSRVSIEYVYVDTHGDVNATTPLHLMGGQGVFVKEVQRAVLDNKADIAVHSAKDLPSQNADGLEIGAIGERRTPNDALIGSRLEDLAIGATIATGSVRRRAQLMRIRPDLQFVDLRGNIQTRLSKIPEGGAIVMAVAALEILGITSHIAEVLDLDVAVPMVGQGSVAIEARTNDKDTLAILSLINHAQSRRAVETERAYLAELGAGCSLPVGAHLSNDGTFRAFMAKDDCSDSVQIVGSIGDSDDYRLVGRTAAIECRTRLSEPRI
ncbi:MAG: hydroxymethylbilane synthase [Actinobacteria bacterium]|uniref:hydroxymethylbilane synthase n=1 Tax=freshwater metagenome TaxID=449393 RepID=A0A6J6N2T3_9ZZZZ|nr:hydroxymethylbilane synthase [Actinomycetota bacterium]